MESSGDMEMTKPNNENIIEGKTTEPSCAENTTTDGRLNSI